MERGPARWKTFVNFFHDQIQKMQREYSVHYRKINETYAPFIDYDS